jgi:23S rRNA pseudouridine1911/1915/1917 synthase
MNMKEKPWYSVVYEDSRMVAVNKGPGISVGADRWDGSRERLDRLLEGLLGFPLYTVHRIDRDTSGLVVFAKDGETHRRLSRAFEGRLVKKRYLAVVQGRPAWKETLCDLSLLPDGDKRHRTIVERYRGKKALTRFRFLGGAGNYSLVEALPETGRTHQIRVHLASLGHPVVCDPLYGTDMKGIRLSSFKRGWRGDPLEERPLLDRLGLHAGELVLPPESLAASPPAEGLLLRAPLGRDLAALLRQMEKQAGEGFGLGF